MPIDRIDIALLQTAPVFADPAACADGMRELAGSATDQPDLFVAPELALTGYDLRDRAEELAVPLDAGSALNRLHLPTPLILGLPEAAPDGRTYNVAALLDGPDVRFVHRKLYLPTYGMFDEARYFAPGERLRSFEFDGWRMGLLVCEDFWHPGLTYALADDGIDALVVLAAAPGRGVWQGGASGPFASWDAWIEIARVYARLYGIYVVLANRVGVEGSVAFAGGSLVAGPDGELCAQAAPMEEAVLSVTLEREELRRARQPAWHRRDDRSAIVVEALTRGRDAGPQ